ncbi:hemolysin family protein [Cellulomonas fengjieae]|uniref:HlyC/CorC family transporter n=1 Tax=Cellulomonas fengjieae TaxID=2819978 RepID=A0ABS3SG92_9CELL|nr:hemolysin family protein [Cellulomonas fengjieae]MBO3084781.1 HlyC/CorC family transporter [Cellulomonas fengjieae]MBO3103747.1 HlyC/CorC family transporter [Cellulomonas fengjieae]QVI66902.1 HlyC/CorC family transporter [Cellulomonas fengjieae]
MSSSLALVVGVLLLAANAFFVGAEFAIISARRSAIEPLAREGDRRAKTVLWAMEHVSLMLACAQLGITVCSTSLGVVAEPAIAHLIEGPLHALGISESLTHPISFVIALAVVVYLHVVLGEMVPKNLAVAGPDRAVLLFGPPLVWVARLVRPIITALNWIANHALRLFGIEPKDEVASAFTAQEVQSIVERSQAEGLIEDEEGLLAGALEFSDRTAQDVMIRTEALVTVGLGSTPEDVERLVARTGFSRFPVVDEAGSLTGYLHLKDVLYADEAARSVPVPLWRVRALAVVGPHDEVEDALAAMQRSGSHLARVDEDGRAVGVVFLEDILEELVGEVRDAMQRGQMF